MTEVKFQVQYRNETEQVSDNSSEILKFWNEPFKPWHIGLTILEMAKSIGMNFKEDKAKICHFIIVSRLFPFKIAGCNSDKKSCAEAWL